MSQPAPCLDKSICEKYPECYNIALSLNKTTKSSEYQIQSEPYQGMIQQDHQTLEVITWKTWKDIINRNTLKKYKKGT
jgi:hypothetical protein